MNRDFQMYLQQNTTLPLPRHENLRPDRDYHTVVTDEYSSNIAGLASAIADAVFESEHDAEEFAMGLKFEGYKTQIWSFRRVQ